MMSALGQASNEINISYTRLCRPDEHKLLSSTPIKTDFYVMSQHVRINGVDVHVGYVVSNILWVTASLFLAGFVSVQLYRLYRISKVGRNPSKFHGLRIQWAHIAAIWLLLFVIGVDVSQVYLDETKFVDFLLGEFTSMFAFMFALSEGR